MWETAKVLGLRNAASKHLAVNQCHPFRCNPSSHFYEDYFLQCIPHPAPSRPTRTPVQTTPGSRTAHTAPAPRQRDPDRGAGHTWHNCFAISPDSGPTPDSLPGPQLSFPVPLGESCRNSKGCGGTAAAPFPRCPPQGTRQRRHRRSLPALPFSRAAVATPHAPSDLPQRVPSAPPPSLSPCLPPRLPGRPRLPAPPREQPGAQLRGAAEQGAGDGALPPSPRPGRREPAGLPRRGSWRGAFPPPRPARRRRRLTRGRTRG